MISSSAQEAILMADPSPSSLRPWREIAQELEHEPNSKKVTELAEELNETLLNDERLTNV